MYLSSNLSYLRKKRGMTQEALSEFLDLTQKAVSFYENGDREPTLYNLIKISRYFNTSIDDLLVKDMRPTGVVLSSNIRHLRMGNGLTQKEFARLLGVEEPAILKYESGDNKPTIESLISISEVFGVTVDDLLKKDLSKEEIK